MRVLKFGGTSLANPKRFLQVAELIAKSHSQEQTVGVLSAPAKITNHLVAIIDKTNLSQNTHSHQTEIKEIFVTILRGLHEKNSNFDIAKLTEMVECELTQIIDSLANYNQENKCPDKVNAKVISRGEKLSIAIMEAWFKAQGHQVTVINPEEKLLAHGDYLESSVDIEKSTVRISQINIPENYIILMAGFTAGNESGELVVLGRNGSDYSAAVLAACLKASCCEIWTDVDGVYTCDPRLVPDAILLASLSYREAMELSYFGAKVIHPRTIGPLLALNIPCLIKNTANPDGQGTLIDSENHAKQLQVKGITNLDNVVMFNVSGPGMQGMIGMAARIFATMTTANISVILITQSSSEYSISFCVPSKLAKKAHHALNQEFSNELETGKLEPIDFTDNLAIVSLVGDGMKQAKGIAAKFFTALAQANINIVAIAQGSSERSISTVIPQNKAIEAVKIIHQALFNNQRAIDIFLVGVGGVGSKLIEQIARQQHYLANKNIIIRVCGIANSKLLIINKDGINLATWQDELKNASEKFSINKLLAITNQYHLVNPVFIDCTSNQQIAENYIDFLNAGFHVITPNKKGNTSSYSYYQQLHQAALLNQRKFMYETNVGAGLPVIENLQNLLAAGDEVIKFDGILSGSLSFIFGKLEEGLSLSEATLLAKQQGFTEPDPRDDLSGQDVARKLLILAREMGMALELSDIQIESVLPNEFAAGETTEQFMQKLPQLDAQFKQKITQAEQENKVLRYIGQIVDGKCSVSIVAVNVDDPLYKVKNGENALAFYTRYYQPIPLLLRGYGAGNDVTAAGIFADILRILPNHGGFR